MCGPRGQSASPRSRSQVSPCPRSRFKPRLRRTPCTKCSPRSASQAWPRRRAGRSPGRRNAPSAPRGRARTTRWKPAVPIAPARPCTPWSRAAASSAGARSSRSASTPSPCATSSRAPRARTPMASHRASCMRKPSSPHTGSRTFSWSRSAPSPHASSPPRTTARWPSLLSTRALTGPRGPPSPTCGASTPSTCTSTPCRPRWQASPSSAMPRAGCRRPCPGRPSPSRLP
mmetsp:Transcript_43712/g.139317  ORF Transcript_43712/g.139317 Transcript_43712/m.139317 type:complete len:230 (-) Transcript_43712:1315-2004(-)